MPKLSSSDCGYGDTSKYLEEFRSKLAEYGLNLSSLKIPSHRLVPLLAKRLCLFCKQWSGCLDESTKPIYHKGSGLSVHYLCLLLACGLRQKSDDSDCDVPETPNAVHGFLIKDIFCEFKRGMKLVCNFCRTSGATIGCSVKECKVKYHFNCGLKHDSLFQFHDSFKSYCRKHRPVQTMPSSPRCETCCICLEDVKSSAHFDTLFCPCCDTAFHRSCVQRQALSFGHYFFKCPACNNKEKYSNEMLRMGIYLPQRDASWETPEAYADLLEHQVICDVTACQCQFGRKHHKPNTDWALVSCTVCGLSGSHVKCGGLLCQESIFICEICAEVDGHVMHNAECELHDAQSKNQDCVAKNTRRRSARNNRKTLRECNCVIGS